MDVKRIEQLVRDNVDYEALKIEHALLKAERDSLTKSMEDLQEKKASDVVQEIVKTVPYIIINKPASSTEYVDANLLIEELYSVFQTILQQNHSDIILRRTALNSIFTNLKNEIQRGHYSKSSSKEEFSLVKDTTSILEEIRSQYSDIDKDAIKNIETYSRDAKMWHDQVDINLQHNLDTEKAIKIRIRQEFKERLDIAKAENTRVELEAVDARLAKEKLVKTLKTHSQQIHSIMYKLNTYVEDKWFSSTELDSILLSLRACYRHHSTSIHIHSDGGEFI